MYYLLTEDFKSQEATLVAMITEAVAVEKIYLLGSSLQQQRTESIFMPDAPSRRNVGHYWLLVLVDKDCGLSNNYVQDKIENNCRHFIRVTVIVLHTAQFNNWLTEGHRFACTVRKIAVVLYDSGNIVLSNQAAVEEAAGKTAIQSYCTQGCNKVNEFIAGAELYTVRKQNKMAAFMLHQAAEQALHTIFKKETGLYINTHNIDKLLRYCAMVNYTIPAIFPKEGEANERLLTLLQKAYIDTRYRDDFSITGEELQIIKERIKALQGMI